MNVAPGLERMARSLPRRVVRIAAYSVPKRVERSPAPREKPTGKVLKPDPHARAAASTPAAEAPL